MIADRAKITYVAVSARRWKDSNKKSWIAKKSKDGWKGVVLIDATDLAQWLDQCPSMALVFAQEMGRLPPGVNTLEQAWTEWSQRSRPATTQSLVLVGRAEEQTQLIERLVSEHQAIDVEADSPNEAYGFFLAALTGAGDEAIRDHFAARSVVIQDGTWATQLTAYSGLIVIQRVANEELTSALSGRHHVLVPLGPDAIGSLKPIRLERANRHDFAQALETMGVSETEAVRLSYECGRSVTILHRRRRAAHIQPPAWRSEHFLLPAMLAGRWDSTNDHDRRAVAKLAALESYDDLEARLSKLVRTSDPPLLRVGDIYTLVAPADAFEICANFISPPHLERFAEVVRQVFTEIDPALDLSPERRPYAALYGKSPRHSRWLRHGLAESLLLIAVRGSAAKMDCNDPQAFVDRLIQGLPGLATDRRLIMSIGSELPVLMESAPMPFLEALEQMLEGHSEEMRELLTEEAHPISGTNAKHVALLWGLEALAWDPEMLPRVALVLANMAKLDPGGKWTNRPINSLRSILLPWHPCTYTNLDQRISVLDLVLDQHPDEGWALLLKLLPKLGDSSSQSHMPRWRDSGEAHYTRLTKGAVRDAKAAIVSRALTRIGASIKRWQDFLDHLPALLPEERARALVLLNEVGAALVATDDRDRLWELVSTLVRRHHTLSDASWTLKGRELDEWAQLADRLSPTDPIKRHIWAFESPWVDVATEPGMSRGDARRYRQYQIVDITFKQYGFDGVKQLLLKVSYPDLVLKPLIKVINDIDRVLELLQVMADLPNSEMFIGIISAEARSRYTDAWPTKVVDILDSGHWTEKNKAALLFQWPFEPATWALAEAAALGIRQAYWETCRIDFSGLNKENCAYAADKLILVGRALDIPGLLYNEWSKLDPEYWLKVIDASVGALQNQANTNSRPLDLFWLKDAFRYLAGLSVMDEMALAQREYNWLSLVLDIDSDETYIPALYKILSREPALFLRFLCDAYRADDEPMESELDEERRSRALAASKIFMRWRRVPGLRDDGLIDDAAFMGWMREARRLAAASDRAEIADAQIGRVLAYAPPDPNDTAWPHDVVRGLLEEIGSDAMERSILAEQHEKRGVYTKSPNDGGEQERQLAQQAASWARIVGPHRSKTYRLLRRIAAMWEDHARREDDDVAKRRIDD